MNKIISIFAILLFSTGTYAAGCDEGSLKGKYSYEVTGVNLVPVKGILTPLSTHVVGQARFDGKGGVAFIGEGTTAGSLLIHKTSTGGTYLVDSTDCSATGEVTWNTGETSSFYIMMDHTDNSDSKSPNKAYHANVVVRDTNGHSASGTLTRFVGKFH